MRAPRVLTRAHTERLCSPLALDAVRSALQPLPPSPYGDTLGGWFAWHLAETQPRFREFNAAELAADCNEWLAARAAEDLLDKADLRGVVDGVPALVSSGPIRNALEALPVPPDDPAWYGMLVGDQAGRMEPPPAEQAAAAAGSRLWRRAGGVPRAGLPAPGGRRRS